MPRKHLLLTLAVLTAGALAFRLFLATRLANDQPDDGRLYAQMASNVLDRAVYSASDDAPFDPTYIRVPGYPLFLAAIYRLVGDGNNHAVRLVQAFLDTATCWLVVLLALAWARPPTGDTRRLLMVRALALAAVCPFLAIYVATILTETLSAFLWTLGALLIARAAGRPRLELGTLGALARDVGAVQWTCAGAIAGIAAMVRPDNGLLLVAALGFLGFRLLSGVQGPDAGIGDGSTPGPTWRSTLVAGALVLVGFTAAIAPWTIRNALVFHTFEPLAPATASMPDEFMPSGYVAWLRTWVDRPRYVVPFEEALGLRPIDAAALPDAAFDSEAERQEVTRLLERYDHPAVGAFDEEGWEDDATGDRQAGVMFTREMDQRFGAIARARIARAPLRYYVILPARRAASLWLDAHAQFYPFAGNLLPLAALRGAQRIFLPLFTLATILYLAAAIAGAWALARRPATRQWFVLAMLLVVPRMLLLASIENPEPRYVVEWFPLVCALATFSTLSRSSSPSAPASRTP